MPARREDIYDEDVRRMYEVEGMSQQEIGDYYGVCVATVNGRLHPDKKKERTKQWNLENPEYIKEWNLEHPERNKEWMLKNPEYNKKGD